MTTMFMVCYCYTRPLHCSKHIVRGNNHLTSNTLMIVAHPDDELIFGGNLLLKGGVKVVCVTNGSRHSQSRYTYYRKKDRSSEFIALMNHLQCSYEIWDFEDSYISANWNEIVLIEMLSRVIHEQPWKLIVTHNLRGEYGHIQHKKISKIMHQLVSDNLYVFYTDHSIINENTNILLELLRNYYPSQKKGIVEYYPYIHYQSMVAGCKFIM